MKLAFYKLMMFFSVHVLGYITLKPAFYFLNLFMTEAEKEMKKCSIMK